MEGMIKVNEDVIQNVSGGVQILETRTVKSNWAGIFDGPGLKYNHVVILYKGDKVTLTGNEQISEFEGLPFVEVCSPAYGWMVKCDVG